MIDGTRLRDCDDDVKKESYPPSACAGCWLHGVLTDRSDNTGSRGKKSDKNVALFECLTWSVSPCGGLTWLHPSAQDAHNRQSDDGAADAILVCGEFQL